MTEEHRGGGLADVFARLTADPHFADEIRRQPADALRGYQLSSDDLRRISAAVDVQPLRWARFGRGAGALLGVAGLVAGLTGVALRGPQPSAAVGSVIPLLPADTATYRDCSDDERAGTPLGRFERGDRVLVIGRSGRQWLVVRSPLDPGIPVWVRASDLRPDAAVDRLPDLSCTEADDQATVTLPPLPETTVTTTTTVAVTTTTTTTAAAPAPTTTTTKPKPTTTTTKPKPTDTEGPKVGIDVARDYFFDGTASCPSQTLPFTVQASDPSGGIRLRVRYRRAGVSRTAVHVGGNNYLIPQQNTSPSSEQIVTIRVIASDALGNTSDVTTTVRYLPVEVPPCMPL